jgi:hypothetical protein
MGVVVVVVFVVVVVVVVQGCSVRQTLSELAHEVLVKHVATPTVFGDPTQGTLM